MEEKNIQTAGRESLLLRLYVQTYYGTKIIKNV